MSRELCKEYLLVKRSELDSLCLEIVKLKKLLARVLQKENASSLIVQKLEQEINKEKKELQDVKEKCESWKIKYTDALQENQVEKQRLAYIHEDISKLKKEISTQAKYCTELGVCCSTLLWRVSRSEPSVQLMITGSEKSELYDLTSMTLESFVRAYEMEWPSDDSRELQFVVSLCGFITNVTASAAGRESLIKEEQGRQLLQTYVRCLPDIPLGHSCKLKCLLLMAVYNVTISQDGAEFVTRLPNVTSALVKQLEGETDGQVIVVTLQLTQGLMSVNANEKFVQQLKNQMLPSMSTLRSHKVKEIRDLCQDILSDMNEC